VFTSLDNTGYIRVNFISDDANAASMNKLASSNGAIMVASPVLMGGYTYPILDDMANGATYQILKADLPKGNNQHLNQIYQLLKQPETVYSYVDEGDVTIVQIEGWDRSQTPMSTLGWTINAGPKTFKRLKTLNRPFRLWSKPDRPLRVYVVEDDSYTNEDVEGLTDTEKERLLDGAFVISRNLYSQCLSNVRFPVLGHDEDPSFNVDYYRSEEYLRQAQFFHAFNARIFGPMEFSGIMKNDTANGMLKGEAFIHASDTCERMHVDIICARSALKFEVYNTETTYVLLEPQKAKKFGVNSDLQSMITLPGVYQPEDVKSWIRDYLLANFENLKNDKIMESWFDMASPFFNSSTRWFDQNDLTTLTKWNARAWLMSGRRVTESPWLFEQLGNAIAKSIQSTDASKLRFPIPCAVRAQVISQSFASMAGEDIVVPEGAARWSEALESIVVNDLDWLEMYRSHGGHDLDDFFVAYYRTYRNCRKIIIVRSPNDFGEYSMFDFVEGDWCPIFERHDGSFIYFPEISHDPSLWSKRLSEVVSDEEIIYTGLPSESQPKQQTGGSYGMQHVLNLIQNNSGSAACVGANVNARALWALSTNRHRSVQLTSMENCIDTGTQGGSAEDADAVMAEAKDIVQQIVSDPTLMIDEYMWMSRFANIFGIPFDRSRLTANTHISEAHRFRINASKSFMKLVRDHAQTNFVNSCDPQVHRLGQRYLRLAYQVLTNTRLAMVGMQPVGEQNLVPRDWQNVHSLVLEEIERCESEVDRHDFMMALYSVCFKVPARTSGKVSDQLVMNPHVFPYLMSAMRFYGLAYEVSVDEAGHISRHKTDSWDLKCNQCGVELSTADPVVLQAYHHHDKACKACRA
jgi:hypothetical protein